MPSFSPGFASRMANLRVMPEIVPRQPGIYLVSRASSILRRSFCGPSAETSTEAVRPLVRGVRRLGGRSSAAGVVLSSVQLKEDWLRSMSCPFPEKEEGRPPGCEDSEESGGCSGARCVIGIDPDVSGALAILKGDTAEVIIAISVSVYPATSSLERSIVKESCSIGMPG